MALDPGMQSLQPAANQTQAMGGAMGGGAMGELPQSAPSTNGPPQELQQMAPQDTDGDYDSDTQEESFADFALSQSNLAKALKDKTTDEGDNLLDAMAQELYQGYLDDEDSRKDWMKSNQEWLKLALLTRETKSYPWPRAANVKYPLIATAAMQFSARAYPALVPSDGNIVKAKVSAVDQQGQLEQAAIRVGKHMSYQILCEIPGWEEDMDKLLMTLAISGLCFKKTYYDAVEKKNISELVYPENLCVNYWAKSLEKAYRKTEILHFTKNEIRSKVLNDEEFLDIEYSQPEISDQTEIKKHVTSTDEPSKVDESTPSVFLAVHTYWDLDNDGYEEPYIVTIHKDTRKVVRIIARWDQDGVYRNDDGKITKICPVEYFTDFPFIPNPDGSIYALGFGILLGPLNEASNTLINQLVDAGTMNNLQSGFLGRNLRIKEGQLQMKPNEWKVVNASGEDLKNSIFPLPTKEPSNVLFQLLQMLITSGNQLASIAEIMVGKMPGQNTPATTTQETIQQGMAVFTAIYKRVYRSLAKEFKKIFRLNRINPDIIKEESEIVGPIQVSDYTSTEHLIIPAADPTGDSQAARMQKLQQVGQLIQMGTINPMAFTQRMLEGLEIPNYQELIAQPQPPAPDPKMETEKMKQQTMMQKAQLDGEAKQQEMQNKRETAALDRKVQMDKIEAQQQQLRLKVAEKAMDAQHKRQLAAIQHQQARRESQIDLVGQTTKMQQEVQRGQMQVKHQEAMQDSELARNEQLHNQKMKLQKQGQAPTTKGKAKKTK